MNTNPEIIIRHAHGPDNPDGAILKRCYFQARLHDSKVKSFRLHDPDGKKIKTEPHHLTNDTKDFTFKLGELYWSVTGFSIWVKPDGTWKAKGSWSASKHKHKVPHYDPAQDDPETGTFQAQSGGGAEEYKASASASA